MQTLDEVKAAIALAPDIETACAAAFHAIAKRVAELPCNTVVIAELASELRRNAGELVRALMDWRPHLEQPVQSDHELDPPVPDPAPELPPLPPVETGSASGSNTAPPKP